MVDERNHVIGSRLVQKNPSPEHVKVDFVSSLSGRHASHRRRKYIGSKTFHTISLISINRVPGIGVGGLMQVIQVTEKEDLTLHLVTKINVIL